MQNLFKSDLPSLCEISFNCDCGKTHSINASAYYGSELLIENVIKNLKGTVAFISSSVVFKNLGEKIMSQINACGLNALNVIINRSFSGKIENVSSLFNLPETVSTVIFSEANLTAPVKYFAGLRNIPVIYYPNSPDTIDFFSSEVTLDLKNKEERILTSNKKILILDKEYLKNSSSMDVANTFVNIISRIIALIDYRIRGTMTKEWLCKNSYNFAREIIKDTFAILKYNKEEIPFILAESGAKMSIASSYTDGKIFSSSSEYSVSKLLMYVGEEHLSESETRLVALIKLLDLYKLFFETKKNNLLEIPDYVKRAEILSEKTGISQKEILKSILDNIFSCYEIDKKLFFLTNDMLKEINSLCALKEKIVNTYYMLGGNVKLFDNYTPNELIEAIYSAPDFPNTFNTLTLIRDVGILEYLDV